mmetsp:Transcript_74573/g.207253  ORF Transcript_74573/g.207253 Transcript_74573/m.207253 type:complete len:673 (-) Transcript_74573:92-2110(-)
MAASPLSFAEERPSSCKAALLEVVDRILRLTLNDDVSSALLSVDVDQLQHRAQEAVETLALTEEAGAGPCAAATPALCGLAVECVQIVEKTELSTHLARLVSAGCELLAALLEPHVAGKAAAASEGWTFDWADETLEDLADQLDFLALEVYCGLVRLQGAVAASHSLPVVEDPTHDEFGGFWDSIEHRQTLEELAAWLLCVIFRAIGYGAVTAKTMMNFANNDLLCLCTLLRGLLALRPGRVSTGLPNDTPELQRLALDVLGGLTTPDLAFPLAAVTGDSGGAEDSIEDQTRVLASYRELLCAAVLETGLLQVALQVHLARVRAALGLDTATSAAQFLSFLSTLAMQVDGDMALIGQSAVAMDCDNPAIRLREQICVNADLIGSLLELVWATVFGDDGTKCVGGAGSLRGELLASCARLSETVARARREFEAEDGFTLACRMLLATQLEGVIAPSGPTEQAALVALAANVEALDIYRPRLLEILFAQRPEDLARARARLARTDRLRLPIVGNLPAALAIFDTALAAVSAGAAVADAPALPPAAPTEPASPANSASQPAQSLLASTRTAPASVAAPKGLRDVVQNAPKELRCELDRKLLCDPVISPTGNVFERATLARWLEKHGPTCPMTGTPLRVEDCQRSAELRKRVTEWVRTEGRTREHKAKREHRRTPA